MAGARATGTGRATCCVHLGIIAHERGDPAAASALLSEAIGLCEAGNQVWLAAVALAQSGGRRARRRRGGRGRGLVPAQPGAAGPARRWGRVRVRPPRDGAGRGGAAAAGSRRLACSARHGRRSSGTVRSSIRWATAQLAETETTLRERLGAEAFAVAWAAGRWNGHHRRHRRGGGAGGGSNRAGIASSDRPVRSLRARAGRPAPRRGRPHQRRDRRGPVHQPATVTTHVSYIFAKLGVEHRAEAIDRRPPPRVGLTPRPVVVPSCPLRGVRIRRPAAD